MKQNNYLSKGVVFALALAVLAAPVTATHAASLQTPHPSTTAATEMEELDWENLSFADVDRLLVEAGQEPVFGNDIYNVPFGELEHRYEYAEEVLFGGEYEDHEWEEYEGEWEEIDEAIDSLIEQGVVTEDQLETMADAQIDALLVARGMEPVFDPNDPFYNMTMDEIDALSDEEFDRIAGDYYDDFEFEDEDEYDFDDEEFEHGDDEDEDEEDGEDDEEMEDGEEDLEAMIERVVREILAQM